MSHKLLMIYDAAPAFGNSPLQNEILTEDGFLILTENLESILTEDSTPFSFLLNSIHKNKREIK